jgi:two-component system chemotaxis sensor kinase CheA
MLSAVRSNSTPVTPALISLCLACLDQVSAWIDRMRSTGEVPDDADVEADDLVRRFAALASPDTVPLVPHGVADATRRADDATGLSAIGRDLLEAQKLMLAEPATGEAAARLESASRIAANVLRHHGRALDATDLEGPLQSSLVAGNAEAMIAAIDRILEGLAKPSPEQPGTLPLQGPEATLRVDVDRIDTLVRLTGELLIAKNSIGHSAERARGDGDPRALAVALKNQHLALDRLVSELQRAVFSLRVLPLQHAFQRFPRLVREMATALGKRGAVS